MTTFIIFFMVKSFIKFLLDSMPYSWDNVPQEKILFTVVLILFGQHCTGKILV